MSRRPTSSRPPLPQRRTPNQNRSTSTSHRSRSAAPTVSDRHERLGNHARIAAPRTTARSILEQRPLPTPRETNRPESSPTTRLRQIRSQPRRTGGREQKRPPRQCWDAKDVSFFQRRVAGSSTPPRCHKTAQPRLSKQPFHRTPCRLRATRRPGAPARHAPPTGNDPTASSLGSTAADSALR